MPQGSYNITRLLREWGLKNVVEMPLRETVQPTLNLDAMKGQYPVHVGGVAMFGGFVAAVGGEHAGMEIQCLDPGGGILMGVDSAGTLTLELELSPTPVVWATGPTAQPAQQFNNNATVSLSLQGNRVAGPSLVIPRINSQQIASSFAPLYVPRGAFLQLFSDTANSARGFAVAWCGILATESDPA